MARMRIIADIYKQIKADDPDSNITLSALRRLICQGVVPTVNVGRKKLIDYDLLIDYLSNPTVEPKQLQPGQIRRVT